jgi:hypothetical protein
MANIPDADKDVVNSAFEQMLRGRGLGPSYKLSWVLTDLLDQGSDSSPTYGAVTATSVTASAAVQGATVTATGALAGASAAVTNNATVGGTLGVTGATTLSSTLAVTGATTHTGKVSFDATDSSGTPGAATVNKPSGQASIAIGTDSVVITNSLVTATSVVVAVLQFVDATLTQILSVVPGAGSFTVTGNANATAATKVGWIVFN